MRVVFWVFLLILLAVVGSWLGGESWLARGVADRLATRADLRATEVLPLRQPGRVGLRLAEPDYQNGVLGLSMPWLRLWVSPLAPTEIRADLPETVRLTRDGRDHSLTLGGGAGSLRLLALHGAAVGHAGARSNRLSLDGAPLADSLEVEARLVRLSPEAPREARSAYEVTLSLDGFRPDALAVLGVPPAALPGAVGVSGRVRLWLDAVPGPAVLAGAAPPPRLVGLGSDGVEIRVGSLGARLVGHLRQDAGGRAEGRLAIYTRDGEALLRQAGEAGLIPPEAVALASAMLSNLGRMPFPQDAVADRLPALPDPAEGELRLPVSMRGGDLYLGAIRIGPAPPFPRPM